MNGGFVAASRLILYRAKEDGLIRRRRGCGMPSTRME
jgi:hypothetical protein